MMSRREGKRAYVRQDTQMNSKTRVVANEEYDQLKGVINNTRKLERNENSLHRRKRLWKEGHPSHLNSAYERNVMESSDPHVGW